MSTCLFSPLNQGYKSGAVDLRQAIMIFFALAFFSPGTYNRPNSNSRKPVLSAPVCMSALSWAIHQRESTRCSVPELDARGQLLYTEKYSPRGERIVHVHFSNHPATWTARHHLPNSDLHLWMLLGFMQGA